MRLPKVMRPRPLSRSPLPAGRSCPHPGRPGRAWGLVPKVPASQEGAGVGQGRCRRRLRPQVKGPAPSGGRTDRRSGKEQPRPRAPPERTVPASSASSPPCLSPTGCLPREVQGAASCLPPGGSAGPPPRPPPALTAPPPAGLCWALTGSLLLTCLVPAGLLALRYYYSRKVVLAYLDCALHTDMADIEQYYMKPPGEPQPSPLPPPLLASPTSAGPGHAGWAPRLGFGVTEGSGWSWGAGPGGRAGPLMLTRGL